MAVVVSLLRIAVAAVTVNNAAMAISDTRGHKRKSKKPKERVN